MIKMCWKNKQEIGEVEEEKKKKMKLRGVWGWEWGWGWRWWIKIRIRMRKSWEKEEEWKKNMRKTKKSTKDIENVLNKEKFKMYRILTEKRENRLKSGSKIMAKQAWFCEFVSFHCSD